MWVTSSLTTVLTPTAVALGNFDGVHRGHQQVIQPVLKHPALPKPSVSALSVGDCLGRSPADTSVTIQELERLTSSICPPSLEDASHHYATVVTFNPHPQEFFTGQARTLLTPIDEKVCQLRAIGVEQLVLLPFDRELASLSPQQFVEEILVRRLQAQQVSVGIDFRFGHKRSGTVTDLQAIAATYGIEVNIVTLQTCAGERISSSAIRQALQQGDLKDANRLLGRSYTLRGQVIQGQQLGRTIGFPTANLQLCSEKFLPKQGVYSVWVYSDQLANWEAPLLGVMNLGCRPTVDGLTQTIEVHLLDWSGDLYGHTLTVSLENFLRPEQKFVSLEALKAQIQADCMAAKALLASSSHS